MADRKTERAVLPVAELLQAMSQSQSRMTTGEADDVALMRLANDPVSLNAFLHRRAVAPAPCGSERADAGSILSYPLQILAVPLREWDSSGPIRRYGIDEPRGGTPHHAFRFTPSQEEHEMAWDGEVFSSPEKPSGRQEFCRQRLGMLAFALAGTALAVILALSFG